MTQKELKQFITTYQELETLAWKRGKEAFLATETGFGNCTGYQRITFEGDLIRVVCYDMCYDLHEENYYYMRIDELLMSDEEWEQHLVELKEITLMNKELKAEKERLERLEEKRKEFERLRKEIEGLYTKHLKQQK